MKKSLLITAVLGWFAFSQTAVAAQDTVTAHVMQPQAVAEQSAPAAPASPMRMAQLIEALPISFGQARPANTDDSGRMPSVPIGLAGLFVMICVLVKRHND